MSDKINYSRKKLIELCEKAIVPEKKWGDRDSSSAHRQIGEAWALLKAGCNYDVRYSDKSAVNTDNHTIWVEITFDGFQAFEEGSGCRESEIFYIPTEMRIEKSKDDDWY